MSISPGGLPLSPPVQLAPPAGIAGLPFRALVARFGAGPVAGETITSQQTAQARPAARDKAAVGQGCAGTPAGLRRRVLTAEGPAMVPGLLPEAFDTPQGAAA